MKSALLPKMALLAVAASLCLFAQVSHAQAVAGVVKKKEGTVQIVRGTTTLPVEVGTQIQAGDLLKTLKDSSVGFMLKDESRVALGPNSQMSLDKFGFDADTYAGTILVNVIKGSFAMVSGLVIKNNPAHSLIRTPTSTLDLRNSTVVADIP
jgi:hypothetical protein